MNIATRALLACVENLEKDIYRQKARTREEELRVKQSNLPLVNQGNLENKMSENRDKEVYEYKYSNQSPTSPC